MARKIAKRQFLVSINTGAAQGAGAGPAITGYFSTFSGGSMSSDVTKVYDGGSKTPDLISGIPEVENVTVSRPLDLDRDGAVYQALLPLMSSGKNFSVLVQPVDEDYRVYAAAKKYNFTGCQITSITMPEYDATSSDAATFEIEFAVKALAVT